MKILIAEDSSTSRMLLQRSLERWGHEVVVTEDGVEAWERYQQTDDIRMVLLDWMMPRMDGIEVCQKIKEVTAQRSTYVIMLTAIIEKERIVEAFDVGADDYITKPFDVSELHARVNAGERIVSLESSLHTKVAELEKALGEVRQLRGIIPICAWCKKIRDDSDFWGSVEDYFTDHSEAQFTHSICPDCLKATLAEKR